MAVTVAAQAKSKLNVGRPCGPVAVTVSVAVTVAAQAKFKLNLGSPCGPVAVTVAVIVTVAAQAKFKPSQTPNPCVGHVCQV